MLIETIGSGNFRDQARRDQALYEERLNALASERDIREQESIASQNRFNTALNQISVMQTTLLGSEDTRRELERGINVIHGTLRRAMNEREELRTELRSLQKQMNPEVGGNPARETIFKTIKADKTGALNAMPFQSSIVSAL